MKFIKLFIINLFVFTFVMFFASANILSADCTESCSGPNTPIYSTPSLVQTLNEQDCKTVYGPQPNGPFTCTEYFQTRTQEYSVGLDVHPGDTYTLQVYSHQVTVVAVSGDDNLTISNKLVDAINATTAAQWNDHGSAPPSGTPGFKPTAEVVGSRPNSTTNRIKLHLNYLNQFGSSTTPVVISNINCPSYGEAECSLNSPTCSWNYCPAEEVISLNKVGYRDLVNKGDATALRAELGNLPFDFGVGDNYTCDLVVSRDNQPNDILHTFLAPTGLSGQIIDVSNTGNNNVYQIICDLNQGGSSDEHSSLPVTIKGQSGPLQVSIGTDICTINVGANSCNLPLSWTTNNPKDPYNTFTGGDPATNGTTGDYVTTYFSGDLIPHGSQSVTTNITSNNRVDGEGFNTSIINQLASIPITITCAGNSKWNVSSSKCENTPTITLSANPSTGSSGQINPTITWTTTNNPTSCTGSGEANWSGSKSTTGGSQTMGVLNVSRTYTYSLVCANASGNSNMATVNVIVSSKPDLTAGATTPTSAAVNVGRTYTATIRNQGTASTGAGFQNLFQTATGFDDPTTYSGPEGLQNYPAPQSMSTLGVGAASDTTSPTITFNSTSGNHYMRACADLKIVNGAVVSGPIDEGPNENNNCGPWSLVSVTSTAKPDLTAGATTPTSAVVNVGRTYTATIRNQGTASTGAGFQNLFQTATGFDDPTTYSGPEGLQNYPAPQSMSTLGVGAASDTTSPTITFANPGNYYMRACADLRIVNGAVVSGPIDEGPNENNNCGPWSLVEVDSSPTIDLQASNPTPTTAVIGVPMKFTSWISNVGNTGTGGTFYNKFQIASEASGNGNVTVIDSTPNPMPALGPNGPAQAQSVNHTFTDSPTTRSVRACADMTSLGNGQITELPANNENNNCSDWVNITFPTVSGNLSASDCFIPSGASTCKTSLNWNTINPISGGVSAVTTTPNNTIVRTGLSATNFLYDISFGPRNFYLYHTGEILLAQDQATASCLSLTDAWINGKCSPAVGGTGSLTISPLACDIAQNQSTCTVTGATWTTTNATQPSLVDKNTGAVLSTLANNPTPIEVWVAYPHTVFELRQNGTPQILDTETVTANCVIGTRWDKDKCIAEGTDLSGVITASDCTIPEGESTCSSNIVWKTINPIVGQTSEVTTPENITVGSGDDGNTIYNVGRGATNFFLYHGILLGSDTANAECSSTTSWDDVQKKCISGGGGGPYTVTATAGIGGTISPSFRTVNSGQTTTFTITPSSGYTASIEGNCPPGLFSGNNYTTGPIYSNCNVIAVFNNGGGDINIDFTASPKRIFKGRSSNLTWTSNADSCVGRTDNGENFETGGLANSSLSVKPSSSTTYTLTCSKEGVASQEKTQDVKVSVIKFFEI